MLKKGLFLSLLLLCFGGMSDPGITFNLENLRNQKESLSDHLGKGPILIDFWATWCKPCVKALPKINALHKKYAKQGLVVIGINEDGVRSKPKVKPFVKSMGIDFTILFDNNSEVMRKFGAQSLPTTVLLSPEGKIIETHSGYSANGLKKIETKIVDMLQEKASD